MFWRQGTKDAQINRCNDDRISKLSGHSTSIFKNNYSTDLLQLGVHASSGNLGKEACYAMKCHVEINDRDYPLGNNKNVYNADVASICISPWSDLS